jgi:hypothetical protein
MNAHVCVNLYESFLDLFFVFKVKLLKGFIELISWCVQEINEFLLVRTKVNACKRILSFFD